MKICIVEKRVLIHFCNIFNWLLKCYIFTTQNPFVLIIVGSWSLNHTGEITVYNRSIFTCMYIKYVINVLVYSNKVNLKLVLALG